MHVLWSCKRLKEIHNEWCKKFLDDYRSLNKGNRDDVNDRALVRDGLSEVWVAPVIDVYKTNCGVAVDRKSRIAGLGIIVRNLAGEVMACSSQRVCISNCSMIANVLAIQRADIDVICDAYGVMRFTYISSQANKAARSLAKYAVRSAIDRIWTEKYPACIRSIVEKEKPG
ncbi:hypothetical protein Ddye_012915 [Dipteronia dyeriana]|uniref:RNase H type-1 domain-containing protein n=1 Tax=Dipteronia dyeriana TaxID=168575 RepID=A0AAD9X588_9ROSI|nr:hypothetical protein Ddye_012915 [Dipteronia dyeriana]